MGKSVILTERCAQPEVRVLADPSLATPTRRMGCSPGPSIARAAPERTGSCPLRSEPSRTTAAVKRPAPSALVFRTRSRRISRHS